MANTTDIIAQKQKEKYLEQLSNLDNLTLKNLCEIASIPGAGKALSSKMTLIKSYLKFKK